MYFFLQYPVIVLADNKDPDQTAPVYATAQSDLGRHCLHMLKCPGG